MNNPQVIDVLVVGAGAGPSGSAVAIDLVRRRLVVRIVDRSPHAFEGSRAKGVLPRSLEVLEDLGALKDVLAGGSDYPKLGIHAGPLAVPWKMFPHKEATPDVPYPNTWLIPQSARTAPCTPGSLRRAYGLTGDALVLIRPDGYIGHIATSDFLVTTQSAARTMFQPSRITPARGATA